MNMILSMILNMIIIMILNLILSLILILILILVLGLGPWDPALRGRARDDDDEDEDCKIFFAIKDGATGYKNWAKTEAVTTVTRPATATARLLMAPSTWPISMALEVPMAWEALPSARPRATGS